MAEETTMEVKEDISYIDQFDPNKKKKKKKRRQDPMDTSMDNLVDKAENLEIFDGVETPLSGLEERTNNHVEARALNDDNVDPEADSDGEEREGILLRCYPWEGTDRDYEYEELLSRMFNLLHENNPELSGDRRRTVMRPPQVVREGTRKTIFVNFMDLCRTMHRQPEHVMTFLLTEMGTSGSLDGQQQLVVKGRFGPKSFEAILRQYMNEYVICNSCKGPDTIITRENCLFFLRCDQCGSGRSVAPFKVGFVARLDRQRTGT